MPREKKEQGERERYSARYRISIEPAIGWDDSHDPSTLPDNALVEAVNCRVHDGIIVSRGGQEKMNDDESAMMGCVYGMLEIEGGVRIFLSPNSQLDVYNDSLPSATRYVRLTDENAEVGVANVSDCDIYDPNFPRYCFARWQEKTIVTTATSLYEIVVPVEGLNVTEIKLKEILTDLPGTPSSICIIPAFPDTLYIGTVEGGVFTYNGSGVVEIAVATTFPDRVILFPFNGNVMAAATMVVKRWDGTVWNDITLDVALAGFVPTCGTEFDSKAFIGGVADDQSLISISASDVCTIEPIALYGGLGSVDAITDLCVHRGRLIAGWTGLENVTLTAALWEYGSTNFYSFGTEQTQLIYRLLSVGGELYIGAVQADPGGMTSIVGLWKLVGDLDLGNSSSVTILADTSALYVDTFGAHDIVAF